jgi:hypothetical protein
MVETYGMDEERFYYIAETVPGTTPTTTPAMLGVPCESIDPSLDVGNILLRGAGNYDLLAIKKGTRAPSLKVGYIVPSANPIELLQWAKMDLDKTLSCQVIYFKGAWATATDLISLVYKYMRIGKASVSCEIDDVVKAQLEMIGQDLVTGTAKLVDATYTDHSGAIAFNETYVKIDTTANDRVVGWKFDINNNPKRVPVIRATNGHLAKYVPFGKRELSGEITFEFESKAEMDSILADTEFDLEFGLYGTNKATFPDCKWSNVSHSKWLEDLISVKAQFVCKGPLAITTS